MIKNDIWVGGGSAAMNITALLNAIINFVMKLLGKEVPEIGDVFPSDAE